MISRDLIVELARDWLDTKYRHQGRVKGKYVDCVGLVTGVAGELGLNDIQAPKDYASRPSAVQLVSNCEKFLIRQETLDLKRGSIAILSCTDNEPQHFAIIANCGVQHTMIHALAPRRKVLEECWDDYWLKRIVGIYEYPGTEPWKGW